LATESEIRRALFDHKKNGAGAKRLWFFHAGHGLAPAGGGPDQAPVIVPADVKDLDFYRSNPIDSARGSARCRSARRVPVYFVDACRESSSARMSSRRRRRSSSTCRVNAGDQARQAVLFATTAGQLANEQGLHGLFGGALIDGLGHGARARGRRRYGRVRAHVRCARRVHEAPDPAKADDARRETRLSRRREPAESLFRVQSSLELARFKVNRPRPSRCSSSRRRPRRSALPASAAITSGSGCGSVRQRSYRRSRWSGDRRRRLQDRDRSTRLRELGEEGRGHRADRCTQTSSRSPRVRGLFPPPAVVGFARWSRARGWQTG
jgi:hypothetical protein